MIKGLLTLILAANTKGFDHALGKSAKQLTGFRKTVAIATKAIGYFGGAFAIAGVVLDAGRRIVAFDAAMTNLSAILRTTREDMKALEEQAISLGGSTIFTATEVGELQTSLAKFGFSSKEIEASSEAILDLAAASGTEVVTAADTGAAALRAFGLDASEMGRVADVMTNAFTKSALTVETFGEAMKFAAPIAASAGSSIEETAAMLAILADNGLRGSIAGTSLRRIFTELAGQGKSLSQVFEETGGNAEFIADAMGFADDAVGKYALSSFLILAKNAELMKTTTTEMGELGSAATVAKKQLGSLSNQFKLLNSAWEGLLINIENGEGAIGETVVSLVSDLRTVIETVNTLVDAWERYGDVFGGNGDDGSFTGGMVAEGLQKVLDILNPIGAAWELIIESMERFNELMGETPEPDDRDSHQKQVDINKAIYEKQLKDIEAGAEKHQKKLIADGLKASAIKKEQVALEKELLGYVEKELIVRDDITGLLSKQKTWVLETDKEQAKLAEKYATQQQKAYEAELKSQGLATEMFVIQDTLTGVYAEQSRIIRDIAQDFELAALNSKKVLGDLSLIVNKQGKLELKGAPKDPMGIVTEGTGTHISEIDGVGLSGIAEFIVNGGELLEMNNDLADSFEQLGRSIGQSLAQGAQSWQEYADNLGMTMAQLVIEFAISAGAAAVAGAIRDTSSIPWGFLAIPVVTGLAMGMVNTAFNQMKSGATAFADGGVVSGTTYAMVGEYGNARNNPEVIAPLDKLKGMLSDVGGGGKGNYTFKLENNVLVAALDRETKRMQKYGRNG